MLLLSKSVFAVSTGTRGLFRLLMTTFASYIWEKVLGP